MAISHINLLIFLLASLFVFPTLRAVDFEYCNKSGYDLGNINSVKISPSEEGIDELMFTISGYASKDFYSEGFVNVSIISRTDIVTIKTYELWMVSSGSEIKAGTNFVLTIDEVPKIRYMVDKYSVAVIDLDDKSKAILCVDFKLPTDSSAPTLSSA